MLQGRRLTAILFTDIEGYTAMMQQNEQSAIATRKRHREILEQTHKRFNGEIVQHYGDGALSIFQSAVEALRCALAMQLVFCQSPRIPVRMGLHMGDVVFDDGNVIGDGVNLASRVESLGVSGSVLFSDKIHDEIKNQPEFRTVSMGTYQFKNVNRLVEIFCLDHDGLMKPVPDSLIGKTEPKNETRPEVKKALSVAHTKKIPAKSVGVLPFVNMSNDPEQDYFSNGISEEILSSLSNLKDLKVARRTSIHQTNHPHLGLQEIGEKLGVKTLLEGNVRKQGNRLRITIQLVNVSDGFHLWSEKYDRNIDDIFAIQEEIALAITEKLKVTLLEKDRVRIKKNLTTNTEAYELYLKGRFHLGRRGGSIMTAIHYFQLAIDLDPGFALAYTGFADASLMAAIYGLLQPKQVSLKIKKAAETALALDPVACEPYCSLGFYYTIFEWNWEKAEKNFKTCLDINPNYTQALMWYGLNFLAWVKRDIAMAESCGKKTIELEPLSSVCFGMYGAILISAGKYEQALNACNNGIELDRGSFVCHLYKGWSQLAMKKYEEATNTFSFMTRVFERHHFSIDGLIVAYCMMEKKEEAEGLLNELKKRSAVEYIGPASTSLSAAFLEGAEEAFKFLDKAYEDRDPVLLSMKYSNVVAPAVRNDPRFQSLLDKIGFP